MELEALQSYQISYEYVKNWICMLIAFHKFHQYGIN